MRPSLAAMLALTLIAACSRSTAVPAGPAQTAADSESHPTPAPPSSAAPAEPADPAAPVDVLPNELRARIDEVFTGDFDALAARRLIRAGVPFSRTFYFLDKGQPRGLSYEYLTMFEQDINRQLKLEKGGLDVHVVLLPMPRDALLPALRAGKIDLVVAQLTITPERQQIVDFSRPTRDDVREVVVTAPSVPKLSALHDLSGRAVFVRRTSSYYSSLRELNRTLEAAGRPPVDIRTASESLEDDDLLEMVNAGLIPATVVDEYLAEFWKQIFRDLVIHSDMPLRSGGALAVAIRKNSPQLKARLDAFVAKAGLSSATGAVLNKKYLQSTRFVKDATSEAERRKFIALVNLFKRYGDQYQFDYLLMAAQGYQESQLNQSAKSRVGAIGVMQLMPETGKAQGVGDVRKVEPNIHAGVKYMRFIRNSWFENEPMDDLNKGLFTFAAYNAGPGRIRALRREAAQRGLDPNVWFGSVERVASERIGRETVTYVSNIYKYYVAYRLLTSEAARRKAAAAQR
jgi:membrane-bound lytic murein transglycosylase MltF